MFIPVIAFLFIAGCGEDHGDKTYRARVEKSYLTDEEITNSVADDSLSRNTFIKNWINSELFYLEALENGVPDDPELKKLLEKSRKELINSFLIRKYLEENKIVPTEPELRAFYKDQSDLFTMSDDAYIVNMVTFSDDETGWKFRDAVLDGNWAKEVILMQKDPVLISEFSSQVIYSHDISQGSLIRLIQGINPGEISPVLEEANNQYTVVKLIRSYSKGSIPDFKYIKGDVERVFIEWKLKDRLEEYTKNLYSKYDIEIK